MIPFIEFSDELGLSAHALLFPIEFPIGETLVNMVHTKEKRAEMQHGQNIFVNFVWNQSL